MTVWTAHDCARVLRTPGPGDDKYSRGVVGLRTGSLAYPGAAVLSTEGAWRAGAGLVRWIGAPEVARLVLARRPETVIRDGRVGAWVVGSGTDADERTPDDRATLAALYRGDVPVIIDAGALDTVGDHAAPLVLTPHAGEFARVQQRLGLTASSDVADDVAAVARALRVVVLRKGATTTIADPAGRVVEVLAETHWTAVAGTGDVLAGAVGAIVAQRPDVPLIEAVATAAWLHARAARRAAGEGGVGLEDAFGGHPIVALDVAENLPMAYRDVVTHAG